MRSWLERGLHVGDVRALTDIGFHRTGRPGHGSVDRLCKRGFLMKTTAIQPLELPAKIRRMVLVSLMIFGVMSRHSEPSNSMTLLEPA